MHTQPGTEVIVSLWVYNLAILPSYSSVVSISPVDFVTWVWFLPGNFNSYYTQRPGLN